MQQIYFSKAPIVSVLILLFSFVCFAQNRERGNQSEQQRVRTVSIPISIFTKQELKEKRATEFVQADSISVKEDGEEQVILSIRSVSDVPLALAVLIQDDLSSSFNLQLQDIARFIRALPQGSRVMVAYLRGGTLQVRQKFTEDLEKAAKSLRITAGSASAPNSPYDGVSDTLRRFDALPTGRRAILLVSDGLDISNGSGNSLNLTSVELEQAILKAQRKGVAVYSFYNEASGTVGGRTNLITNGQSFLNRLSDETGGRAFFQGSISPVSFEPFFKDLRLALNRQFVLTYLSTHFKKGYHKVKVTSTNPEVKIEHPKSYNYK
jgi:VWFA-related protein